MICRVIVTVLLLSASLVACSITNPPTLPATLPGGTLGSPYTSGLLTTDGTCGTIASWTITLGSAPPGVSIVDVGGFYSLGGTPTSAGTFSFTLHVIGSSGSASQPTSITVGSAPLLITLANLPHATIGVSYPSIGTNTVTASGGTPPYTCAVTAGALPSGLTISGCAITGIPSCGSAIICDSNFTVTVTDSTSPTHLSLSASYDIAVLPVVGAYGGMWPVTPCTSTGYYQMLNIKGHWLLADGNCQTRPQFQLSDATDLNLASGVLTARYGGSTANFAAHELKKMVDTVYVLGDYTDTYFEPAVNTVKLPWVPIIRPFTYGEEVSPSNQVCNNGGRVYTQPIKNIIAGVPASFGVILSPNSPMPDPWDGATGQFISDCVYARLALSPWSPTDPYVMAWEAEDGDFAFPLKALGTNPDSPNIFPNAGFLTAVSCSSFNGSGACALGYASDPTLHAKVQWCGYLQGKYSTTAAWNASWGSGSYYTSFGSAGGYGVGTGCLDEDGKHGGSSAWLGTSPFVPNGNANVIADFNQFVYEITYQFYSTEIPIVKAYDPNHLVFGPSSSMGGPCGYGMPPQVPAAMKAAGIQAFIHEYDPTTSDQLGNNCAANISAPLAVYNATGMPFMLWVRTTSSTDSPQTGAVNADYATQLLRGSVGYQMAVTNCFNAGAADGSFPCLGLNVWDLLDNSSENYGFGIETINDDAYDGNCASSAARLDAYGVPCGGQGAKTYGNFIGSVTQAHINEILALYAQTTGSQSSALSGTLSGSIN